MGVAFDGRVPVAGNLRSLAVDLGISEDAACRTWADSVDGLEPAPGLDPIVGSVKGIGPALFAYMRMRAGGDALKADLRVTRGLRLLGFEVPGGVHATLVIARALAEEIGTSLLVLEQLLWWLDDGDSAEQIPTSSPPESAWLIQISD